MTFVIHLMLMAKRRCLTHLNQEGLVPQQPNERGEIRVVKVHESICEFACVSSRQARAEPTFRLDFFHYFFSYAGQQRAGRKAGALVH